MLKDFYKKAYLQSVSRPRFRIFSISFAFWFFFLVAFRDQVFVPYNNKLRLFPCIFPNYLSLTSGTQQTAYASMRARRI